MLLRVLCRVSSGKVPVSRLKELFENELTFKHFAAGRTPHKSLNRNNLKVSYSCMENMADIIKRHNNNVLSPSNTPSTTKRQVLAN